MAGKLKEMDQATLQELLAATRQIQDQLKSGGKQDRSAMDRLRREAAAVKAQQQLNQAQRILVQANPDHPISGILSNPNTSQITKNRIAGRMLTPNNPLQEREDDRTAGMLSRLAPRYLGQLNTQTNYTPTSRQAQREAQAKKAQQAYGLLSVATSDEYQRSQNRPGSNNATPGDMARLEANRDAIGRRLADRMATESSGWSAERSRSNAVYNWLTSEDGRKTQAYTDLMTAVRGDQVGLRNILENNYQGARDRAEQAMRADLQAKEQAAREQALANADANQESAYQTWLKSDEGRQTAERIRVQNEGYLYDAVERHAADLEGNDLLDEWREDPENQEKRKALLDEIVDLETRAEFAMAYDHGQGRLGRLQQQAGELSESARGARQAHWQGGVDDLMELVYTLRKTNLYAGASEYNRTWQEKQNRLNQLYAMQAAGYGQGADLIGNVQAAENIRDEIAVLENDLAVMSYSGAMLQPDFDVRKKPIGSYMDTDRFYAQLAGDKRYPIPDPKDWHNADAFEWNVEMGPYYEEIGKNGATRMDFLTGMNQAQKDVFFYIYNDPTQGKEKAYEYLDAIAPSVLAANAKAQAAKEQQWASDNPLGAIIQDALANPARSIDAARFWWKDLTSQGALGASPNDMTTGNQRQVTVHRGATSDWAYEFTGDWAVKGINAWNSATGQKKLDRKQEKEVREAYGNAGRFLKEGLADSGLDSAVNMGIGAMTGMGVRGLLGSLGVEMTPEVLGWIKTLTVQPSVLPMSIQAGAARLQQAKEEGYSDWAAQTKAGLTTLGEWLTETVGMEWLVSKVPVFGSIAKKNAFLAGLAALVTSGAAEGMEEIASGVFYDITEGMANLNESDWAQKRKDATTALRKKLHREPTSGEVDTKVFWDECADLGLQAASAAMSAGASAVFSNATSKISTPVQARRSTNAQVQAGLITQEERAKFERTLREGMAAQARIAQAEENHWEPRQEDLDAVKALAEQQDELRLRELEQASDRLATEEAARLGFEAAAQETAQTQETTPAAQETAQTQETAPAAQETAPAAQETAQTQEETPEQNKRAQLEEELRKARANAETKRTGMAPQGVRVNLDRLAQMSQEQLDEEVRRLEAELQNATTEQAPAQETVEPAQETAPAAVWTEENQAELERLNIQFNEIFTLIGTQQELLQQATDEQNAEWQQGINAEIERLRGMAQDIYNRITELNNQKTAAQEATQAMPEGRVEGLPIDRQVEADIAKMNAEQQAQAEQETKQEEAKQSDREGPRAPVPAVIRASEDGPTMEQVSKRLQAERNQMSMTVDELKNYYRIIQGLRTPGLTEEQRQEMKDRGDVVMDARVARNPFEAPARMDGRQVTVTGIESTGKDATVTVKDGDETTTVPLKNVKLRGTMRQVYERAAAYTDLDTARLYLYGWQMSNTITPGLYARAFEAIYTAGRLGNNLNALEQQAAQSLPEEIAESIRKAGDRVLQQTEQETGLNEETTNALREAVDEIQNREDRKSGLYFDDDVDPATIRRVKLLDIVSLDDLARRLGTRIRIISHIEVGNTNQDLANNGREGLELAMTADAAMHANAEFNPYTGEITVALDAMENGMFTSATHEVWHYIRELGRQAEQKGDTAFAREVESFGQELLKVARRSDRNFNLSRRVQQIIRQYESVNAYGFRESDPEDVKKASAIEEIQANALFALSDRILSDEAIEDMEIRELAENHPNVIKRIRDGLMRWTRAMKKTIERISKGYRETSALLQADEEKLDKLAQGFSRLVEMAGQRTYQQTQGEHETARRMSLETQRAMEEAEKAAEKAGMVAPEQMVYSLAGQQAQGRYGELVRRAEEMAREGRSDEEIRQETGAIKGFRGRWWALIDREGFRLKEDGIEDLRTMTPRQLFESGGANLARILDAPELFEAYPDLKTVGVQFEQMEPGEWGFTIQDGMSRGIYLSEALLDQSDWQEQITQVLLHEVQHVIQGLEGSESGANVSLWRDIQSAYKTMAFALSHRVQDYVSTYHLEGILEQVPLTEDFQPDTRQMSQAEIESFNETVDPVIWEMLRNDMQTLAKFQRIDPENHTAYELYRQTVGEIEARAQEERGKWQQPDYRGAVALEDYFDVGRGQVRYSLGTRTKDGDEVFYDDGADTGKNARYSLRVTDPDTLRMLDGQPHIVTYKTMKLLRDPVTGESRLYPPKATMAGRGQMEDYSILGQWEQAVEHPEWIKLDKKGNPSFDLVESGSKTTAARYNPYMHSSNLMINDQFTGAYQYDDEGSKLGRFVTVECWVPQSETTSGYHAQHAKDSVGWHPWHAGTVAGAIHQEKGVERQVFLSRWIKPVRIVPDAEVAQHYRELLEGTKVQVPDNVVPPSLLKALREAGVPIRTTGKVPGQGQSDVQYSLAAMDQDYMAAVERGDTRTAQRMVEEAAEQALAESRVRDKSGRLLKMHHGTSADFTVFDREKIGSTGRFEGSGFNFTPYESRASSYGRNVLSGYLDIRHPLSAEKKTISVLQLAQLIRETDPTGDNIISNYARETRDYGTPEFIRREARIAARQIWNFAENDVDIYSEISASDPDAVSLIEKFSALGYDGLIHYDENGDIKTAVAFSSNQFKMAEPVTRDDQGKVIPLSQRFNQGEQDIRYSLQATDMEATEEEIRQADRTNRSAASERTGLKVDAGTRSAYADTRFSMRTHMESEYVTDREKMIQMVMASTKRDRATVSKWFDDVMGVCSTILANRERLDYLGLRDAEGHLVNKALHSNPEYGGSIDMSLICAKRRLMTGTIDAIQRRLGDSGFLTADEMMTVRRMLLARGYQAACGLCFVESSRKNMGKVMSEFRQAYMAEHANDGTYIPSMTDINTVDGLADLQIHHPDVYRDLTTYMNRMAQRKPKMYEVRTEYDADILKRFRNDETVEAKNRAGGLRINSFSDFEIVHLIDMMQVIMDMAAVGLAGQAYTKVPDFALALGRTGLKINLSLISKGVGKDGRIIFDDVEGMPHEKAFEIREMYSKNVGTILVVFTEKELRAAVNDDRIDFIIPFHRSQWKKSDYPNLGLAADTRDFTMHQNERWLHPSRHLNANGNRTRPENFKPNEYWRFDLSGRENAERYLRMCAEQDRRPKFAKYLVDNHDGSWSLPADGSMDGYWKLLIDFKMYDNDGVGARQEPVVPDFNMDECARMLREYEGGHDTFPVADDVVEAFLAQRDKKLRQRRAGIGEEEQAQQKKDRKKGGKQESGRFALSAPVEYTRDLVAVHNLDERGLLADLRMGGFPMPSIAVVKRESGWHNYGDISVVFDRHTVDPQINPNARLYGGDAYTPTLGAYNATSAEDALQHLQDQPERGQITSRSSIPGTLMDFMQYANLEQAHADQDSYHLPSDMTEKQYYDRERRRKKAEEQIEYAEHVLMLKLAETNGDTWYGEEIDLPPAPERAYVIRAMLGTMDWYNAESAREKPTGTALVEAFNRELEKASTIHTFEPEVNGLQVTDENAQLLEELLEGIHATWRGNFQEGKPNEIVGFDHVKLVIVPDSISTKALLQLDRLGIRWEMYAENEYGDARLFVLNRFVDEYELKRQRQNIDEENPDNWGSQVRFSLNGVDETSPAMDQLIAENQKFRDLVAQMVSELNNQEQRSTAQLTSKANMRRLAKELKDRWQVSLPMGVMTENLSRIFMGLTTARTPAEAQAAIRTLGDFVKDAIMNASSTDTTDFDQYSEVRARIRSVRVTAQTAKEAYGDWESFKRNGFGRVKLVRYGENVDAVYQEIVDNWPGLIRDGLTGQADQLNAMLDFLDATEIHVVNPYETDEAAISGYGIDQATRDLSMHLLRMFAQGGTEGQVEGVSSRRMEQLNGLLDRAEVTVADTNRQLTTAGYRGMTSREYEQRIRDVRQRLQESHEAVQQRNETIAQLQQQLQTAKRETRNAQETVQVLRQRLQDNQGQLNAHEKARLQQQIDDAEQKAKAAQRQADALQRRIDRRNQTEERNKVIREILRRKSSLMKKLNNPNANGWVPVEMVEAVTELLQAVDTEGQISGTPNQPLSAQALQRAKAAYEAINKGNSNGQPGPMASYYNGDLAQTFDELARTADGKRVRDLTQQELEQLRDIVAGYAAAVINEDRIFTQGRSDSLRAMGADMIEQAKNRIRARGEAKVQGRFVEWLSQATDRGLLKPVTVFERMKGTVLGEIWQNALRPAEWKHIRHIQEAEEFLNAALDQYHQHESVDQDGSRKQKRQRFDLTSGRTIELTDQELMTLYAWQKREAAMGTNHLLGGGIKLANPQRGATMQEYRLTPADLQAFNDALTDEQKAYVDHMVQYLSTTVGEWGNEVTRELYGIEKFREQYYLPFTVAQSYVAQQPATMQDQRIKTASFTRALTDKASTTLELRSFTEMWASHVEQMSDFNSFTLPIEDMVRLMNFKEGAYDPEGNYVGQGDNVRPLMERGWGSNTVGYIHDFLSRLNGNSRNERGGSWLNTMMGKAKSAAVTWNISVAFQQAGAGVRALAEMDPRDVLPALVTGIGRNGGFARNYAELQKYAPIAVEKAWGYFDTNMNRGLYQRAQTTWRGRLDDMGGWMASMGDELNWSQIWDACKHEIRRLNPNMTDEEVKQHAADRFVEVIDRTQVVDSIFQRSAFATEKGMMRGLMSFMSEPVTMYNMIVRCVDEFQDAYRTNDSLGKRQAWGKAVRTGIGIILSAALTAFLKSLATGLRDRDNDKKDEEGKIIGNRSYWEKVFDAWAPNFGENLMGLTTIFGNMYDNAVSQYGNGDLTTAWISNLYNAGKEILKGENADWEKVAYRSTQALSNLTGIGFAGLYRDAKAIISTTMEIMDPDSLSGTAWDRSKPWDVRMNTATKYYAYSSAGKKPGMKVKPGYYTDMLVEEYMQNGMSEDFQKIADAAISVGASESGLMSSFKDKLKKAEPRIGQAARALADGDAETYDRLMGEILKGGIGSKAAIAMVKTEYNEIAGIEEEEEPEEQTGEGLVEALTAEGSTNLVETMYKKPFIMATISGDTKEAKRLGDLLKKGGVSQADMTTWTTEKVFSSTKDTGLYWMIKEGKTKEAKAAMQYLIKSYPGGQQAVKKRVLNWAKGLKQGSFDYKTVRDVLLAVGFSQRDIDNNLKK